MVPFSFESITRAAAPHTLKELQVSEAARATHESFESHLGHAPAFTRSLSTRGTVQDEESHDRRTVVDAVRSEPVRQTAEESRDGDNDVREDDTADTEATSRPDAARNEEDREHASVTGDEVVVSATIEEQRDAVQELGPRALGDANDNSDDATAGKLADASLREEESELDPSLAASAETTDETGATEADRVGRVKRGSDEPQTAEQPESPKQLIAATGTNEEIAANDLGHDGQVLETTVQHDEVPAKSAATKRRGNRNDIAAYQSNEGNPDVATRAVDAALVETATNTTGDDDSRQRRSNGDSTRPTGQGAVVDEQTTTPGTPSRFAQHLLSRTGDPNARGPNLTDADQARFVDRVARAVQATGDRGGTLRLRLSPPELGSLTLEIRVQGGTVAARVEADTPAARNLLLENLPLLRERLAEHGMRVEQFDVDLTDRHAGGTHEGLAQNDRQQEDRPRSKDHLREPEETPPTKSQEGTTAIGSGQLNIIV